MNLGATLGTISSAIAVIKRLCTPGHRSGCSSQGSMPGKEGRIGKIFLSVLRRRAALSPLGVSVPCSFSLFRTEVNLADFP